MIFVFGMAVGAVAIVLFLVVVYKAIPDKDAVARQMKHIGLVEAQLLVFNERVVEERRLASALEAFVNRATSTNIPSMPVAADRCVCAKCGFSGDKSMVLNHKCGEWPQPAHVG